jgi:hypothetical protein
MKLWELDKEGGTMEPDSYGSTLRTAMKKSMAEPYRSLNKRISLRQPPPQMARMSAIIVFSVMVIWLGIMGIWLFGRILQP